MFYNIFALHRPNILYYLHTLHNATMNYDDGQGEKSQKMNE